MIPPDDITLSYTLWYIHHVLQADVDVELDTLWHQDYLPKVQPISLSVTIAVTYNISNALFFL